MKERPILFSGAMVRAILAGTKTQTRRLVRFGKLVPSHTAWNAVYLHPGGGFIFTDQPLSNPEKDIPRLSFGRMGKTSDHGVPGDRLWVRETWCPEFDSGGYLYAATHDGHVVRVDGDGFALERKDGSERSAWRPSIHMPRAASRLTLEVSDVRVQRLHDISEEDAIAEGGAIREDIPADDFHPPGTYGYVSGLHPFPEGRIYVTPPEAFAELWDSIYASKDSWDSNPWVWCVSFKRVTA